MKILVKLYKAVYCVNNGFKAVSKHKFTKELKKNGFDVISGHINGRTMDEYYDHFTAFSLLSNEFDTLSDFECVPYEKGMVIH